MFPVFSSANCSCLTIYVKPPVHVSSHPDDRFPQSACSCLLRSNLESPSLASRYIFKVQADQQVCTALQKKPTFSLSVTFSIFLCQIPLSLCVSVSLLLSPLSVPHRLPRSRYSPYDDVQSSRPPPRSRVGVSGANSTPFNTKKPDRSKPEQDL